jgi:hypothetical protein
MHITFTGFKNHSVFHIQLENVSAVHQSDGWPLEKDARFFLNLTVDARVDIVSPFSSLPSHLSRIIFFQTSAT